MRQILVWPTGCRRSFRQRKTKGYYTFRCIVLLIEGSWHSIPKHFFNIMIWQFLPFLQKAILKGTKSARRMTNCWTPGFLERHIVKAVSNILFPFLLPEMPRNMLQTKIIDTLTVAPGVHVQVELSIKVLHFAFAWHANMFDSSFYSGQLFATYSW